MTTNAAPEKAVEGEIVEVQSYESLSLLSKAEIDIQISTAHAYRRSIKKFRDMAFEIVSLNERTAAECYYTLKRRGKGGTENKIEGASIRLAEIVACSYGNMRAGGRIVLLDKKDGFITGQGVCHDLENNLQVSVDVRRRITTSEGRLFNDDMINVTGMASVSIAYRNAVLRVVPKALWQPLLEKAQSVVRGDEKTLESRRTMLLGEFKKLRVSEKMIFDYLEVKGLEDIGLDDLVDLRGVFNSIKTGQVTIEEEFGSGEMKEPQRKSETKAEPKPAPQQAAAPQSAPQQTAPTAVPAEDPLLNEQQAKNYMNAAFNAGWSITEQKAMLTKEFGVESFNQLRLSQVEKLSTILSGGSPK